MSDQTVTIGDREFTVRRPKLGQLRRIIDALDAMQGQQGGALIDASVALIIAGLAPAHSELTADALLDLESSIAELNAAVAAILDVAGLRSAAEGEATPHPVAA